MAVRTTAKTPSAPPAGGAEASGPSPSLVPHGAHAGKPALPLHRPLILIGSRQRAHVHLISNSVSRVHAVIINTAHGSYVRDLASRTGTIVNGRQVKEAGLRHSDTLQVGAFQFKFSDATGRGPLAAAMRAPAAVLHVQGMAAPFALEGRTALIGQRDTCDIAVRSTAVSTAHAIVFELNGRHFVRDLGSRTGTFVNGRQIHQEALEVGDMVRIGETAIRYASAAPSEAVDVGEDEDDLLAMQARGATGTVAEETVVEEEVADEAIAEEPVVEERTPQPIPVTNVVPVEEPHQEEFQDLAFAAEGDVPIAGDEPQPVGELTGTVGDADAAPPAVVSMPIEPLGTETQWRPAAPVVPEEPAEQVATTHLGFDPDEVPLSEEAPSRVTPPPLPGSGEPSESSDQATAEDVFGATGPLSGLGSGPVAIPPPLPVEEPTLPLDDPEPAVAEAESLAPMPQDDGSSLNPDIDFPSEGESESIAAAINEPFGPLTDLSLDLKDDAAEPAPATPKRSLLDEIDLAPTETPTVEPTAARSEPAGREPVEAEPIEPGPIELEPIELESSLAPSDAFADALPLSATELGSVELAGEPGTQPEPRVLDLEPGPTAPAAAPETVATFDPVVPDMPAAADVAAAEVTHLEPPAVPANATATPIDMPAEPFVEPETPEAPLAPTPEVSATIPADLDIAPAADATPVETTEPPAAPVDAPPKKRGGRKAVAKKAAPEVGGAAAKKRRPWGKKAKEAAAADEAAAAAAAAAAASVPAEAVPEASVESISVPDAATPEPPASVADVVGDAGASVEPAADDPSTAAETLAPTEPSPESALQLDLTEAETTLPRGGLADDVSMTTSEAALDASLESAPFETPAEKRAEMPSAEMPPSDRAFDAMIEEFVGPSTGPIVEQREGATPETPEPQVPPGIDATAYDAPVSLEDIEDLAAPRPDRADDAAPAVEPPAYDAPIELEDIEKLAGPQPTLAGAAAPASEPERDEPVKLEDIEQLAGPLTAGAEGAGPAPELMRDEPAKLEDIERLAGPQSALAERPAPAVEPPAVPPREAPPRHVPPRPAPAFDPFLGMGRDLGSFIGGMPLDLSSGGLPEQMEDLPVPEPFSLPPMPHVPPRPAPAEPHIPPSEARRPPVAPSSEPSFEPELPDEFAPPELSDSEALPSLEPSPLDELLPPAGPSPVDAGFDPLELRDAPAAQATPGDLSLEGADLDLPDLSAPEFNEPVSGTASEGLLDQAALELPELGAPVEEPPAIPPAARGRADDDQVDPLLFTEAESPTLHLLPTPQAPRPQPPVGRGAGQQGPGRTGAPPRPASKYPATPPPPARSSMPRRAAPRAPFDIDSAGLGPALGVPSGAPPVSPGAGSSAAHAFDGLAIPPVREADVFSGLPLGADDPVLGGSKSGNLRKPGKRGPGGPGAPGATGGTGAPGAGRRGGADVATPEELAPLSPLPPLPPVARRRKGAPAAPADEPTASPGAPAPHAFPAYGAHEGGRPAMAPHAPGRGWGDPAPPPRRGNIGLYLVLMILALIGVSAGIYFLGPRPSSEVVGSLQFERLRDLGQLEREQFASEQREWLARPEFRQQAKELLMVSHEGVAPGFLGTDDPSVLEYDKIVRGVHVKDRTGSLTMPYRGKDPSGDRARMDALVKTLHARNLPRGDAARVTQAQYARAQSDLAALADRLAKAGQRAKDLRLKAESVPDLEKRLNAVKGEYEKLRSAAAAAKRDADRLRAELGRAQGAAPDLSPAAWLAIASLLMADAPESSAATSSASAPATAPSFEDDAQLREWRDQLAWLEATLAAAPAHRAARRTTAAAPAPAVARDERQRRPAGAKNPGLLRMEEELAYKVRHRNAALGGGLAKEAARLDVDIAELDARLAVAREIVGAGLPDGQTGELQKLVEQRLGATRADAAPEPAADRAMRGAPRDAPRDANPDRGAAERRAAELRAKIAAREAELAAAGETVAHESAAQQSSARETATATGAVAAQDAARDSADAGVAAQDPVPAAAPSEPAPAADRTAAREQLQAQLSAAQEREAEAAGKANALAEEVRKAETDLTEARRAETELTQVMKEWSDLEARHTKQIAAVDELRKAQASSLVPVEPDANAVTVVTGDDHRYLWMLIAGGVVVVLFSFLMWHSAHGSPPMAIPDRENPFEAPVIGAAPPPADPNPDDERPLPV